MHAWTCSCLHLSGVKDGCDCRSHLLLPRRRLSWAGSLPALAHAAAAALPGMPLAAAQSIPRALGCRAHRPRGAFQGVGERKLAACKSAAELHTPLQLPLQAHAIGDSCTAGCKREAKRSVKRFTPSRWLHQLQLALPSGSSA
ncbi:hypothetical protein ABPG75_001348 [Micractinium tetrahymenae]